VELVLGFELWLWLWLIIELRGNHYSQINCNKCVNASLMGHAQLCAHFSSVAVMK